MTTVRSDSFATEHSGPPRGRAAAPHIPLPPWVSDSLQREARGELRTSCPSIDGLDVHVTDAGPLAMCSVRIEDAAHRPSLQFRQAVARAYLALFRAADELPARHRVRMWSFIPDIHAPHGHGLNTYHVFNQGRFDAFATTLGSDAAFASHLPTATAVGHDAAHLTIHCLTSLTPGLHVENPRQVPAYRYSDRYGPRPPCFARGTIVSGVHSPLLLVGGTASVRNEVSMHPGDLSAQLAETFENLAALTSAARAAHPQGTPRAAAHPCAGFTHLRVYSSRPGVEQVILDEVRRRIGTGAGIELVTAHLCREELLVEIEGVVDLHATS